MTAEEALRGFLADPVAGLIRLAEAGDPAVRLTLARMATRPGADPRVAKYKAADRRKNRHAHTGRPRGRPRAGAAVPESEYVPNLNNDGRVMVREYDVPMRVALAKEYVRQIEGIKGTKADDRAATLLGIDIGTVRKHSRSDARADAIEILRRAGYCAEFR